NATIISLNDAPVRLIALRAKACDSLSQKISSAGTRELSRISSGGRALEFIEPTRYQAVRAKAVCRRPKPWKPAPTTGKAAAQSAAPGGTPPSPPVLEKPDSEPGTCNRPPAGRR